MSPGCHQKRAYLLPWGMAARVSASHSPLALLVEALEEHDRGHGSPFLDKMIQRFLAEIHAADPTCISLPDGRSILAETFGHRPQLGLEWWRLRGPEAWQPTPATPNPVLSAFVREYKDAYNNNRKRYVGINTLGPSGVSQARTFLRDALDHGMPLSLAEVQSWDPAKPLDRRQKNLLAQQEGLVSYCLFNTKYEDLAPAQKLTELIASGAALPTAALPVPTRMDILRASKDALSIPVVMAHRFGTKDSGPVIVSWWQDWLDSPDPISAPAVARAMRAARFPKDVIAQVEDCRRASDLVDAGRTEKKPQEAWRALSDRLASDKSWSLENDGSLIWHDLILENPRLLACALTDPAVDWSLASSTGLGIWDHLRTRILDGSIPKAIQRLAKKVPPVLHAATQPLCWTRAWATSENKCQDFMSSTFNTHPGFWLGSPAQQAKGALKLVESWLEEEPDHYNDREASVCLNALFDPILDRSLFSPKLHLALHAVECIAAIDPDYAERVPNALAHPVGRPDQVSTSYQSRLSSVMSSPRLEEVPRALGRKVALGWKQAASLDPRSPKPRAL